MLDALRRGAKTWVAKLLMLLLVASFGIWGIADYRFGGTAAVAEVGGTEIDPVTFQRAYTRQLQALSRQFGQPIDADFAQAIGLPQQVVGQLLAEATLTEAARDLGLGISDEALAQRITEDPTLRPPGSESFDRGYFVRMLRDNGLTEQRYVADRRLAELRGQVTAALAGGMAPPDAYVAILDRYRAETRSLDYVVLPTSAAGAAPVPSDEDIETWYEANVADFQAPEYRTLSILSATPESLADPDSVAEEDVRREYDRARAEFTEPERRRVRQVLFASVDEARAAASRIAAGETLDAVIAERGLAPADVELGLVTREDIVDPAIAEAAFSLAAGAVSEPVEARFGGALVQVTEIAPETVRPFEEAAPQLRERIAVREAERGVLETHDEIEDARAGGATLPEIAERFGLTLRTVETDASGLDPAGNVIAEIPAQPEVLRAAFEAAEGEENDPVPAGRGFVWYAVDAVRPSQDRPLEEVREEVVAAWTREKVAEALAARAEEMAAAVRNGDDLARLASAAGLKLEKLEGITRATESEALGPEAVAAAFGGPQGHVTSVPGPGDTRIVLRVTDSTVPPYFAEQAETRQVAGQLRGQLQQSVLDLYVAAAERELGATVNQQALQAAVGSPTR